jgi:hypothetical protein
VYLALHIAEVFTTWETTADPAGGGDLGDEVLRVLNVGGEGGDEGSVLVGEEGLSHGVAGLAGAADFGVLEVGLHLLVAATAAHEGDGEEGAFLGADVAAPVGEAGLVLEDGVGVHALVIEAEAFAGVHHVVFHGEGVDLAGIRDEVSGCIVARTVGLFSILENGGGIVLRLCESLDIHLAPFLLIVLTEKLAPFMVFILSDFTVAKNHGSTL